MIRSEDSRSTESRGGSCAVRAPSQPPHADGGRGWRRGAVLVASTLRAAITCAPTPLAMIGNDQRDDALLIVDRSPLRPVRSVVGTRACGWFRSRAVPRAIGATAREMGGDFRAIELGRNLGGEMPGDLPETWPRKRPRSGSPARRFLVENGASPDIPAVARGPFLGAARVFGEARSGFFRAVTG